MIRIVQRVSRGMHDRMVIGAKWGIIRDEQIAKDRENIRKIIMYQKTMRGYHARISLARLRVNKAKKIIQPIIQGWRDRLVIAQLHKHARATRRLSRIVRGLHSRYLLGRKWGLMKDEQMRKDVKVQAMIRIVQRVSRGMHDRIVIGTKWGVIRDEQIVKDRESIRRIIMYQGILRGYNARRSVAVLRAARQVQRFGRGVFARRLVCALKVQKLRAAKLLRNVFAGLKERMQVRHLSQQALLGLSLLMKVASSNEVTPLSCCGLNQLGLSCIPAHSPEDRHSSKLPRKLHVLSDNLSISHDHKLLMDVDRHEKYSVHVYHDGQAARNEAQAITLLGCGGAAISHHSIIIYRPIQPSHRTLGEIASHLTL
eukprot:PhF_6_TR27205/c0_g1_i3/m.40006